MTSEFRIEFAEDRIDALKTVVALERQGWEVLSLTAQGEGYDLFLRREQHAQDNESYVVPTESD